MSDAADLHAVQRTLRGDTDAFGEIVERYTPVIYSLAVRMLDSAEDAEEATQEVFLKAYRSLSRFHLSKRFYPWLYTIAVNYLRSQRRKRRRRDPSGDLSYDESLPAGAADGPHEAPETSLLRTEARRSVDRGLERLKAAHREVFVLRELEGLSVADVAEVLGIAEGTVKTHLHRAKRELARHVLDEGWHP